jgi:hypothetical protein
MSRTAATDPTDLWGAARLATDEILEDLLAWPDISDAWARMGNGERHAARNSIMALVWERLDDLCKSIQ